eukprot:SAG31_NODE_1297_length_8934_cov_26.567176_7_plen_99_part_00
MLRGIALHNFLHIFTKLLQRPLHHHPRWCQWAADAKSNATNLANKYRTFELARGNQMHGDMNSAKRMSVILNATFVIRRAPLRAMASRLRGQKAVYNR